MKTTWKCAAGAGILLAALGAGGMADAMEVVPGRIDIANREYSRRFGNEEMAVARTDPELAEMMKNFTYGTVTAQAKLGDTERELVRLAALATLGNDSLFRQEVKGALAIGVRPIEIREAMYQLAPYIGFPKVLDAVDRMNAVFAAEGITLPLPAAGTVTEETRYDKGLDVQVGIYGDYIRNARGNAAPDAVHVRDDLSDFCFGDIYTRKVLDVQMREMLTLTALAVMGGAEPQLKGHIQGNLAVGTSREKIISVITECISYMGFPRTLNAIRAVDEVVPYGK